MTFSFVSGQTTNAQLVRDIKKKTINYPAYFTPYKKFGKVNLEKVVADEEKKIIQFYFNETLVYAPIREAYVDSLTAWIKRDLGKDFQAYQIRLFADNIALESYIPNYFRERLDKDSKKSGRPRKTEIKPLITRLDSRSFPKGLQFENIALWHSHGLYFDISSNSWKWQRPRLFGSVEDMGPISYVLPYLAPMLENAGATTFIPRERDTSPFEIIVDNDGSSGRSELKIISGNEKWKTIHHSGFAWKDTLFDTENPFELGSHLQIKTSPADSAKIIYLPEFPKNGNYAVYLSWVSSPENSDQAYYTVNHAGGMSRFSINQQMGGKTWIYLGTFPFREGKNEATGSIELSTRNSKRGIITADAIRFGGGQGNVARYPSPEYISRQKALVETSKSLFWTDAEAKDTAINWNFSQRDRFLEGARYYMQYSGIPYSVYSPSEGKNDYNDDYQSRGSWVNYLMGEFQDPTHDSIKIGLNIPIDLSFAFHTDAGMTSNDSVIGSLAIYSSQYGESLFPNGQSKMANRDLADIVQTQLASDIRTLFKPDWTRRGLWDKAYSEAWRPKAPSMLLELLSHQNLTDMRYSLDPRFRFAISRSIYKGILRYLSEQEKRDYKVQPLPPDHFAIQILNKNEVRLTWKPVSDPLEPTANPTQYRVYKRMGEWGFDSGILVSDTSLVLTLQNKGEIYSFKVAALNEGGESFPTEILAVCLLNNDKKPILVVNAFDRICAPKIVNNASFSGIAWWDDQGVPMNSEIGFTGNQYDFDRKFAINGSENSEWGASYKDSEGKIIPGNTFDFVFIHGKSIVAAGFPFVSVSNEYFEKNKMNPATYSGLDLLFGEQRTTPSLAKNGKNEFTVYTPGIMQAIRQFADANVSIFASGAYIGTDMTENQDKEAIRFAREYLRYSWQSKKADDTGLITRSDLIPSYFPKTIRYNAGYNPNIYTVESPDAIGAVGKGAMNLFRYSGNNSGAAIISGGKYKTIILGFPFEAIPDQKERDQLMKAVLRTF